MRSIVGLLMVVPALGLAGCGGDDGDNTGAADETAPFEAVPWVLGAGLGGADWQAAPPSLTFDADTVGGFGGCNRFTAAYTVDGDSLEIGTIASTRMACPPPADAVERAYLDALGRVRHWSMDDDQLVLLDEDGGELLRYDVATPVGSWQATAIQTGNALASPLPGTEITATFADDGTVSGTAGCNTYSASYTTDRGAIEIAPPAATKKACAAPDGVMEQEAAYLAALPTAARYRLDGAALALLAADGTYVASYARAEP